MRKFILLTACIFTVFMVTAQNDLPDNHKCCKNKYRYLKNMFSESTVQNFDVLKYKLEMDVDPESVNFKGKTTISFKVLQETDRLTFDAGDNLVISSVYFRDQEVADFTHHSAKLDITLPSGLNIGEEESVIVLYTGVSVGMDGGYVISKHDNKPVAYTFSESFAAPLFWVCKDDLNDKANEVELHITHPSQYKTIANGLLISETDNTDGTTTTFWHHKYPVPTYLIAFAIADYDVYTNSVNVSGAEIPIINYVYSGQLNSVKSSLDKVPYYISFLSEKFGDYPYKNEKYGHAQWKWGGGMEHATVSFVSNFSEDLVVHELMHQWFGDKVTCASWSDIWLNEGFATYGEALLRENRYEEDNFKLWKNNCINIITRLPGGSVYNPEPENEDRIFDSRLTYTKAGMVVNQLRYLLGDDLFFEAMTNYLNDPRYAYSTATTENFKQSLQDYTGIDMTEFFNDWVYGEGFPTFSIDIVQKGNIKMTVSQETSHKSVDFFETPFEVMFIGFMEETYTKRFDLSENNQVFEFDEVPFAVNKVLFNPNYDIIAKSGKVSLNNNDIMAEPLLTLFPNPVSDKLLISSPLRIQSVSVWDMSGSRVLYISDVNDFRHYLDFSAFGQGTFILKTELEGGLIFNDKIIKN